MARRWWIKTRRPKYNFTLIDTSWMLQCTLIAIKINICMVHNPSNIITSGKYRLWCSVDSAYNPWKFHGSWPPRSHDRRRRQNFKMGSDGKCMEAIRMPATGKSTDDGLLPHWKRGCLRWNIIILSFSDLFQPNLVIKCIFGCLTVK